MYLLDTNVLSELMRPRPAAGVVGWTREQPLERLHVAAVTIAEVHFGLALIEDDERHRELRRRFDRLVVDGFSARVIDFDRHVAAECGRLQAQRCRTGRPMSVPDAQIAATARTSDLVVATRNVRDFRDLGLDLFNPFDLDA
ncbi:MAG: type II toxin-antitoxin system VapC family toxin [Actinomycetota bacterium]